MNRLTVAAAALVVLSGCQRHSFDVSSSATFDAIDQPSVTAAIISDGPVDKTILVKGDADKSFRVTVGGSFRIVHSDFRSSSEQAGGSSEDIWFEVVDGVLQPRGNDWTTAGGGDGAELRRESDREITIYYPLGSDTERRWVRFRLLLDENP